MMNVCVTGATGFLGHYIVKLLSERGYFVHAFGRNQEKGRELEAANKNVVFIKGNLEQSDDVLKAVKGCSYVVHAGALSSAWGSKKEFYDTNVTGTIHVLKACEHHGVKRLVFISSPSIYTKEEDQYQIEESQGGWDNRLNTYIQTKLLAEKAIRTFRSHAFEKVILRPRGLFGIGDTSIIPRLMRANKITGIPVFRNGNNLVDITYVENAAYSVFVALKTPGIDGATYNITNGEPMKFKTILMMFLDEIGLKPKFLKLSYPALSKVVACLELLYRKMGIKKEPVFTRYTLMTLAFSQTLDIEKARKELGYEPLYSIEKGIQTYAEWYRKQNCGN